MNDLDHVKDAVDFLEKALESLKSTVGILYKGYRTEADKIEEIIKSLERF